MLTAFVLALVLAPAADVAVITPEQAKDHVGHDVVVQGQVWEVGESKAEATLFLNFGGKYPFHVFNAVIFSRNLQTFPDARSWKGRVIKVRGKIELYEGKGKPEIILERQEQVTIDPSTTLPQGSLPESMEDGVENGGVGGVRGATGIAPVMDIDSPPRPIRITRPQYPQEAFVQRIEGTVVVEILIDSQGRVVRARVLKSVPLLDAAALATAYQWVFLPAVKNGRPVPTIAHAPVAFRIYTKEEAAEQRRQRPAKSPQ